MSSRSSEVLANTIQLRRQQHQGPLLIVVGRDDRLFMEKFVCQRTCKIVVGEGKDNICEAIAILQNSNFTGVLGAVDADFHRFGELPERGPNIVMPDYHDLETMLLCSSALSQVLIQVLIEDGSQEKLTDFGENVLDALIQRALTIGCLRLYSSQNDMKLRFNGLNYSLWVETSDFSVDDGKMITAVKNLSQRHDLSSESLSVGIRQIKADQHNPLELCNGTDLIKILSIGLRSVLGSNSSTKVNAATLRKFLRLAYTSQDFVSSELAVAVQSWEARESGHRVLRRPAH